MFKWLAAISIDLGAEILGSVLHIFLPSIQRETLDSSQNSGKYIYSSSLVQPVLRGHLWVK